MDNSLLAVRGINHKYIVVGGTKIMVKAKLGYSYWSNRYRFERNGKKYG
jgi:hypothetical protein